MGVVVLEDASRGVNGAVDAPFVGEVGEVEGANDVGADGVGFVVFAPVNVGAAGDSSGHENVGGFHFVEFLGHVGAVFAAGFGEDDFDSLFFQEGGHFAADPAGFAAVDESFREGSWGGHVGNWAFGRTVAHFMTDNRDGTLGIRWES